MKNLKINMSIILICFITLNSCSDDNSVTNTSVIKITATDLDFGDVNVTESSQVRSYTIAAEDITGDIKIQVDAPFYISISTEGDYSNSLSLSPDDFGNEAIPVFVKFQPAASDEGLYEDEIVHTCIDRDNIASVNVSGVATIPGKPVLVVDENKLDFGNVVMNQQSEVQSYTLSGSELESDVTIKVSDPFHISLSAENGFGNSVTLNADDVMNSQVIYVRFDPQEEGASAAVISHTSEDLEETIEVSLSGTGDPIPEEAIFVNPATLDFGSVPLTQVSDAMSYTLKGNGLTSDVTVTGSADFKLSAAEDGEYSETLTIPASDFSGGEDVRVFVRFESTGNTGEKTAEITHTTPDVDNVESVTVSGVSISAETKLFSDDFDYTSGQAIPSTDRTSDGAQNEIMEGWLKIRTGNSEIPISSEGLSYTGYPGSGTGNSILLDMDDPAQNSNLYAHNLSLQQDENFVGSYYTSFMIKVESLPDETGGGFNRSVMLIDWLPNGTAKFLSAVQINYNDGDPKFGIMYEGAFTLTDVTPEVGKTYLIVLKHTITDADQGNNNNLASVYIFNGEEIPATEPETADALVNIENTGDNYFVKAVAVVRDNSRGGSYLVDGIRVSTQWADLFE